MKSKNKSVQRNRRIYDDYLKNKSLQDIANKYDLSISMVKKIIKSMESTETTINRFLLLEKDESKPTILRLPLKSDIFNLLRRNRCYFIDDLKPVLSGDRRIRGIGQKKKDHIQRILKKYIHG